MKAHCCPCCGYLGLASLPYENLPENVLVRNYAPPYALHWGMPSYEVCPCCGFEFGNGDEPGTATPLSFEDYLAEWTSEGTSWFDESKRPKHWDLKEQLNATEKILRPAESAKND